MSGIDTSLWVFCWRPRRNRVMPYDGAEATRVALVEPVAGPSGVAITTRLRTTPEDERGSWRQSYRPGRARKPAGDP